MKISADKIFEEKTHTSLDIGSDSIKVVQIRETPRGAALLKAGCAELNVSPTMDSQEGNEEVIQKVKQLWKELKIKTKQVRLVISDPNIYSRHINVPRVVEEELTKAIKWQAEKYVPFSIDEAIVDYQLLGTQVKENDNEMEIVLVAVEQNIVNKYLSALKALKIMPSVLDYSPFAVAKAVIKNHTIGDEEILPIIDIGAETSSIVIIKGEGLVLTRNIRLAGKHLTEAISEAMDVDQAEAETIKREFDLFPAESEDKEKQADIFSGIETVLSAFVSQVNRSFAYCEEEYLLENIQKVILCGGGAKLKGLDTYLSQKLKLPVERASPFKNIIVDQAKYNTPTLEELSLVLMGALGEAL